MTPKERREYTVKVLDEDLYWTRKDGTVEFDEELGLAVLLAEEIVFVNEFDISRGGKGFGSSTIIFVNASDVFMWACAAGRNLLRSEIQHLYELWRDDPQWGRIKWCCIDADTQPQKAIRKDMQKVGVWDETMEKLGKNPID